MNTIINQRRKRHFYYLVACILLLSSPIKADQFPDTIILATQVWPPYQQQDNDTQTGYSINALKCVMNKMNQKFKVLFVPWGRAQNGVKSGVYDGFFAASQNQWRDQFAVLSNTFIEQQWRFYFNKDYLIPNDVNQWKQITVFGARLHSNTYRWLNSNNFKKVRQFPSIESLIKLLSNKRIDAIMENSLLFEEAARQSKIPLTEFQIRDNMQYDLGVYFGKSFLKHYPQFLDTFNRHAQICRFSHTN